MFTPFKTLLNKANRKLYLEVDHMPEGGINELPTTLRGFMWFFMRQIKGLLALILVLEIMVACSSSLVFWYVGQLVKEQQYTQALLLGGLILLLMRQFLIGAIHMIYDLVYNPYFGNMIRRQLFWFTANQSLGYFQNDFAGRIANKIIQIPSLRDAVKSMIGSVWFASIFTISNIYFMAQVDLLLAVPLLIWLLCYAGTLAFFVPKVKARATIMSEDMSMMTGQIVDSLTNILPAKYFARLDYEDDRIVKQLKKHSGSFRATTGTFWKMSLVIDCLNSALIVSTAFVGLHLVETNGHIGVAAMAMALPMALQATFQSGWIMFEVSGIFENLGRVQDTIDTLAKPHKVTDKEGAKDLDVKSSGAADIIFKDVSFNYGQDAGEDRPVLENFSLEIPAGQKVGLVGRSGAGKTTITGLLVRAHDIAGGEILIGGQNIAAVTQDSLRKSITMVTQDSYLFHRSVRDNILYGHPDATQEEVELAARRAHAHEFIPSLEDNRGRKAYDAFVGERGVKLSGGQRQRVAIARAVLKKAPILILDEATSALDSESEHAIQSALESIMVGKTVIAIAHRLSTLRQMDRILVMEHGKIIEDGTHEQLTRMPGGHYAKLWQMQSGGFLGEK